MSQIRQYQGLQTYHGLQVEHHESGTLFHNPRNHRTYQIIDNNWVDVSLAFPWDDYWDYRIRYENMRSGHSNYMPRLALPAVTEDITYEEVYEPDADTNRPLLGI